MIINIKQIWFLITLHNIAYNFYPKVTKFFTEPAVNLKYISKTYDMQ